MAAGRISAAPREGRGRVTGEPRALAARSSIMPIVMHGGTRVVGAADSLEGDFLEAGLRGDLLRVGGTAAGNFGPVGILPPTPDEGEGNGEEEAGRAPMSPGPEDDGNACFFGIAEAAKEESFMRSKYKINK